MLDRINTSLIRWTTPMLALPIALPLAIAGGCSSTTTTRTQAPTPSKAEWNIDHAGWSDLGYQWEWTGFPLMNSGEGLTDAVAYDDMIVTTASDTTVTAIESSTGKVRWAKQLGRATTQLLEPTRIGNTLYICSNTELFEIDAKNGNTLDSDTVGAIINTKPTIINNLAFFGTEKGHLYAWERTNDFVLWSYGFKGDLQSPAIKAGPDTVAMISQGGDFRVLTNESGTSLTTANIAGGAEVTMIRDNNSVIIPSTDQSIYSFNLNTGSRNWRVRTSESILTQPVLHDGIVYASTADHGLAAIDAESGSIIWNNNDLSGWVVSIAESDELIVWNGASLSAVDIDNGDLITSTNLNGAAGVRADEFIDGNIFVITPHGSIAKFSRR